MRGYRKDIADLLKGGKLDYAIIRVESVIREQLTLTGRCVLYIKHVCAWLCLVVFGCGCMGAREGDTRRLYSRSR